jgi:Skp family chaperone for outer membrane proteins
VPLAVLSLDVFAQESGSKIGFISVNALLQTMPEGRTTVMNAELAASSGLLIYADLETTDLTADVKTKF